MGLVYLKTSVEQANRSGKDDDTLFFWGRICLCGVLLCFTVLFRGGVAATRLFYKRLFNNLNQGAIVMGRSEMSPLQLNSFRCTSVFAINA
jgi:hypothetical protein